MKYIMTWLLLGWAASTAYGQYTFTGRVIDRDDNKPLVGVTVLEKGTFNGVVTDIDGVFAIELKNDTTTLILSYIGYAAYEIPVKGGPPEFRLSYAMNPMTNELSEVVVTALGIKRERKALGYSVQEIESRSLTQVREPNLLNALSGRVAGVQVTNGSTGIGSSSLISIRGEVSLSGNNQPLFVVDGVPITNTMIANNTENDATGFQEVDYGNGAAEISPDDIASINVLKGPTATALYGSRASNGVVVINTKDGVGTKGIGISVNSSVTFEQALVLPQYQNEYGQGTGGNFEYVDGVTSGGGEITSYGPRLDGRLLPQFTSPSTDINGNPVRGGDVIARNGNPITATPWIARPDNVKDFFETGVTYTNNVALSGNDERGNYRLSFSNLNSQGIVPNSDLQRNSIASSFGYQLSKRLKARTYINYIRSTSDNRPATGYGSENVMYLFTWMGRQADVNALRDYWQRGREGFNQFNYNYSWMDNPYFTLYENLNGFDKDRLLGNLSFEYTLNDALRLRVRSGTDTYHDLRTSRRAFSSQRFRNGAYREDEISFREINTDVLLTYRTKLNRQWELNLSGGANRMDQQITYKSTTAGELSVPGIYNFENSRIPLAINQENSEKRINSLYALGQLAYKSRWFFDLTVRNDWSSTLPADNNSYAYYSGSVSAIVSDMLKLPRYVSFAKVRLSAASVGSDTDPYSLQNSFNFGNPYGSSPTVSNSDVLFNDDLRPERTDAYELGADIRFWANRVGLDVTYYNSLASDQIVELPVSAASGYTSRVVNGGSIRSKGLEVVLNLTPVKKENFRWNSWFNFSRNRSIVEELPDEIDQYVTGFSRVYGRSDRSVFYIAREGGRVGDMYGTGLLTVNGQHVYDANGNPVKDPNLRLLGNYNPDFILGWGNELTYKNWQLGFLFDWRHGGTIVSRTLAIATTSGALENSLPGRETGVVGEGVTNIGSSDNPIYVANETAIPAQDYYNQFYDRDNEANALYDASFLKLRQIRLGYVLPENWLQKAGIVDATVSLIARNVFLWTENPHFDPELITMQGRNFTRGVEDMSLPSSRSWGLSLSFKL